MVGVTQLGTSYDFNKLKKGLDSVQKRNQTPEGENISATLQNNTEV